jgi:hypothetical protein
MVHGNQKKNDQIASSTGKNGSTRSQRFFAILLPPIFAKDFYPTSTIRHPNLSAISKD